MPARPHVNVVVLSLPSAGSSAMNNQSQSVAEILAERQAALDRGDKKTAQAKERVLNWHAKRTAYGGTSKEITQQADMAREASQGLQQIKKERRASLGRKAAAGAAGAVLAGALTAGLVALLSKKKSDNGEAAREERRRERRSKNNAFRKGGVVKRRNKKKVAKKAVKKAVRKAVHKKTGKR